MTDMIARMAERLFAGYAYGVAPTPTDQKNLWAAVEDAGLPLALVAEESGGFGLSAREAMDIVRIAAGHAAFAPVGETMLANWLLTVAGLEPASGAATFVTFPLPVAQNEDRLCCEARRVPWGRQARTVVVVLSNGAIARFEGGWTCHEGANLAGEPRDDLDFDCTLTGIAMARSPVDGDTLLALGATLRASAIAGAAEAALQLAVSYANDRTQFGRPIGAFQAIQQNLAIMAEEVAAARAAADMAARALPLALTAPDVFRLHAAAAKLRAGEAAGRCAGIAHQIHGAIGFTREYALHPLTCRLWSWRDEFGSETRWAEHIGATVLARAPGELWPFLTSQEGAAP